MIGVQASGQPAPGRHRLEHPIGMLAVLGLIILGAMSARASDGVNEINQVCAELSGCFSGDTASFPVTISEPGSYRLTSNLELALVTTTAIVIKADDVSIDLGGFSIRPRIDCRPDCGTTPGSGSGISAVGQENIHVRNGTIIGMGASAVVAGDLASVIDVRAIGLGGAAIVVGDRAEIRRTSIQGAGGIGIALGNQGLVTESLVHSAAGDGIRGGTLLQVTKSRVIGNTNHGIRITESRGLIIENLIANNGNSGLQAGDALVAHNVFSGNQDIAVAFFGVGGIGGVIRANHIVGNASGLDAAAPPGSVVTENSIVGNAGTGLNASGVDGFSGNVIAGNAISTISGVEMGVNVCNGNMTCP